MKTPEILWPAIRQYRHNYGNDELIYGFDEAETLKVVATLQKRIAELEAENAIMVKAIDNYAALPHHLSGPAKDVINSIHKLRSEGGAG